MTTVVCLPGISCEGHTLILLKPLLILGFLSLCRIESYLLHRDSSILCSHLSLLRAIDLLRILFFLSHLFHPNGFKLHMDQWNGRSPKGRKDSLGPLEKGSMSWSQGPCSERQCSWAWPAGREWSKPSSSCSVSLLAHL